MVNPISWRLKRLTIISIDKIMGDLGCNNYKIACHKFYDKAKSLNINTGFKLDTFDKFYLSYRKAKYDIKNNIK